MPRNLIGNTPFTLRVLDTDQPLTEQEIVAQLGQESGISLCIRSESGHIDRGGYFFHIESSNENYVIQDFEGNVIDTLNLERLVRFVNHVSGRRFDPEMLHYCQSFVNFRVD